MSASSPAVSHLDQAARALVEAAGDPLAAADALGLVEEAGSGPLPALIIVQPWPEPAAPRRIQVLRPPATGDLVLELEIDEGRWPLEDLRRAFGEPIVVAASRGEALAWEQIPNEPTVSLAVRVHAPSASVVHATLILPRPST
jgi:hypothetical protein